MSKENPLMSAWVVINEPKPHTMKVYVSAEDVMEVVAKGGLQSLDRMISIYHPDIQVDEIFHVNDLLTKLLPCPGYYSDN